MTTSPSDRLRIAVDDLASALQQIRGESDPGWWDLRQLRDRLAAVQDALAAIEAEMA
jgi:hypothetical protein